MTAPRPEAVESLAQNLQRAYCQNNGLGYYERWTALIAAALTAARVDERERAAKRLDKIAEREHGRDRSIVQLCAAAIRAMEGR